MEADWEVEIGGGAPVIEALWPGFIDLRRNPDRIGELQEGAAFPPLAALLLALNAPASPLWTAKCDLWEPESGAASSALACYVDVLPAEARVFLRWQQAESFCREWAARLDPVPAPQSNVELVVRQAVAGEIEGFGITAYLAASGPDPNAAAAALAAAMVAFAGAVPPALPPATRASKLQWESTGE